MALGAVRGELGLVLHPRAFGRILDQQEGLLGFTLTDNAFLVFRLTDALQPQVAPTTEN